MQEAQPEVPPQPSPFIIRVDTYENEKGQRLFDRVLISGTPPSDFNRFIGIGQVNIPQSPVGPIHQSYNFVIDADSLDRAFALFDSAGKAEGQQVLARIVAEVRRQTTAIQPADARALDLLDQSGNPIKRPR